MTLDFYWYPNCGTCKKAKKWLDGNEIDYNEIHIVETPPSKEQLHELISNSGLPIKNFFNTSGKKYRELGLKDKVKDADDDQLIGWLASDGMLLKRPIVTDGMEVTVGFKGEVFEKTWK